MLNASPACTPHPSGAWVPLWHHQHLLGPPNVLEASCAPRGAAGTACGGGTPVNQTNPRCLNMILEDLDIKTFITYIIRNMPLVAQDYSCYINMGLSIFKIWIEVIA